MKDGPRDSTRPGRLPSRFFVMLLKRKKNDRPAKKINARRIMPNSKKSSSGIRKQEIWLLQSRMRLL